MKFKIHNSNISNGLDEYETMVEALSDKKIMSIVAKDGGFEITEACDDYFFVEITPEQLAALGYELIAISRTAPTQQFLAMKRLERAAGTLIAPN